MRGFCSVGRTPEEGCDRNVSHIVVQCDTKRKN